MFLSPFSTFLIIFQDKMSTFIIACQDFKQENQAYLWLVCVLTTTGRITVLNFVTFTLSMLFKCGISWNWKGVIAKHIIGDVWQAASYYHYICNVNLLLFMNIFEKTLCITCNKHFTFWQAGKLVSTALFFLTSFP